MSKFDAVILCINLVGWSLVGLVYAWLRKSPDAEPAPPVTEPEAHEAPAAALPYRVSLLQFGCPVTLASFATPDEACRELRRLAAGFAAIGWQTDFQHDTCCFLTRPVPGGAAFTTLEVTHVAQRIGELRTAN